MTYTIKQVSEMMSLPVSTIRYYDKMGLIPFLEKNESGYRIFKENAQFKKIVALSNLIQRRYHNDIHNMLP